MDPLWRPSDQAGSSSSCIDSLSPPVEALRDPLFYGRLPGLGDTIYTVVAAVLALALGAFVFNRVDDQIAVEV